MGDATRPAALAEAACTPDFANESVRTSAKIMIVDDDPTTLDLVRFQLDEMGYRNVVSCRDGADALRGVARENPDLLLLDLVMPGANGLDILRAIRESADEFGYFPILILTAVHDSQTKIKAFELGATDFLNKPVNFFELGPRVRNALVVKAYHDQLKRHADELQKQVESKTARLQESHAALEKANLVLRRSCEAAEAAARAKSEFLANISHELRTPLTAIIGFTEELLAASDGAVFPDYAREFLEIVLRNGEHLLELVSDILDVARIEKGRLPIERVVCSPQAVVSEVAELLGPRAGEKGLELVVESAGPVPETISSDPTRLRQILTNLLSNAIKFTRRGSVRLMWRLLDADSATPRLQFEVIDSGIGMAPEQLTEIFKPFSQAHPDDGDKYSGTGLGLTICKYLAEELGGHIRVESSPGAGSTFRVTIATGPLHGLRVTAPREYTPAPPAAAPPAEVDAAKGRLQSIRILVVEDAPDNQRLIQRLLERAGAQVTVSPDGRAAFEVAMGALRRQEPFNVVLTDIQMPFVDGYQLARELRENGYRGRIIAVTANAMAGERQNCLAAGCDDYLVKPIDRDDLLSLIARHTTGAAEE